MRGRQVLTMLRCYFIRGETIIIPLEIIQPRYNLPSTVRTVSRMNEHSQAF